MTNDLDEKRPKKNHVQKVPKKCQAMHCALYFPFLNCKCKFGRKKALTCVVLYMYISEEENNLYLGIDS